MSTFTLARNSCRKFPLLREHFRVVERAPVLNGPPGGTAQGYRPQLASFLLLPAVMRPDFGGAHGWLQQEVTPRTWVRLSELHGSAVGCRVQTLPDGGTSS